MIKLNGEQVNVTRFPDGTSQVWKVEGLKAAQHYSIEWVFTSESELIHLAQLKDLLTSMNCSADLILDYLPYGRQDKGVGNDSTFALTTFSGILNAMEFTSVIITDPHSMIALGLIERSKDVYPIDAVNKVIATQEIDLIVYPDKGATYKYKELYNYPYTYCSKVRDQSTGDILEYELVGDVKGKKVLIVDDICDGGATFIRLAGILRERGVKDMSLFVSHGIFSKGIKVLQDAGINKIYTKQGRMISDVTYERVL